MCKKSIEEFANKDKRDDEDLEEVNIAELILKAECIDDVLGDDDEDSDWYADDCEDEEVYVSTLREQCEILFFQAKLQELSQTIPEF